jgi:hypothetical protein
MQGFGFCVWLVGSKGHAWQHIVREIHEKLHLHGACRPHIRVKSNLSSPMVVAEQTMLGKTTATVCGDLFVVTTNVAGWPPLHTIELPVRLDPDNHKEDMHVALAHRFGVLPFSAEDISVVKGVLTDYDDEDWKTCERMVPVIANVMRPDVTRWRDVSP